MSCAADFIIENGVLIKYVGQGRKVIVPDGVHEIGEWAFAQCDTVESINLPDEVTVISPHAFILCRNLTEINLPAGVEQIGDCAFTACLSLPSIKFPDGLRKIGQSAFSCCTSLKSICIPGGVLLIEEDAFESCKCLTDVFISEGVAEICKRAFGKCRSLSRVALPKSLLEIGTEAFYMCDALTDITIPENVGEIGDRAFAFCLRLNARLKGSPQLKSTVFNHAARIISPHLSFTEFESSRERAAACMGYLENRELFTDEQILVRYRRYASRQRMAVLQTVFEDDSVAALTFYEENGKITAGNFEKDYLDPAVQAKAVNCSAYLLSWKNDNLPENDLEREFERAFRRDPFCAEDMKKLWDYDVLQDGSIMLTAYKGNDNNVYIPERIGRKTVTKLGRNLFGSCADRVNRVYIPYGVTTVFSRCFASCRNLWEIHFPASVKRIDAGAFLGCEIVTLYAPADSYAHLTAKWFDIPFEAE